jgi:Ca-activated chloride channel family protein
MLLSESTAVEHLWITVGERNIEGQINEKCEAKDIYLQAKGKKTSLIIQQRPNMSFNSIANIGPDKQLKWYLDTRTTKH